jgi:hypothetical protein
MLVLSQVDLEEFDAFVSDTATNHEGDGLLQLQLISGWLTRAFAGVSYHHDVILGRAPLATTIHEPWKDVSPLLQDAMLR